jgi:hypothetical protein
LLDLPKFTNSGSGAVIVVQHATQALAPADVRIDAGSLRAALHHLPSVDAVKRTAVQRAVVPVGRAEQRPAGILFDARGLDVLVEVSRSVASMPTDNYMGGFLLHK